MHSKTLSFVQQRQISSIRMTVITRIGLNFTQKQKLSNQLKTFIIRIKEGSYNKQVNFIVKIRMREMISYKLKLID